MGPQLALFLAALRRVLALLAVWLVFVLALAAFLSVFAPMVPGRGPNLPTPSADLPLANDGSYAKAPEGCAEWPRPGDTKSSIGAVAPGETVGSTAKPDSIRSVPIVAAIRERDLLIDIRTPARLQFSAVFDRCSLQLHLLRETLERAERLGSADWEQLRKAAFGDVSVWPWEPRFGVIQLVVDEGEATVRLQVETANMVRRETVDQNLTQHLRIDAEMWTADSTRVTVLTPPDHGVWGYHRPTLQRPGEGRWTLGATETHWSATVLLPTAEPEPVPDVASGAEPSLPMLMRVLKGRVDALGPVWLGIAYAIPFLVVGAWARRTAAARPAVPDATVLALLRGCRVAIGWLVVLVVVDTVERLGYIPRAPSLWIADKVGLGSVAHGALLAKCALLAFAWPALAGRTVDDAPRGRGTLLAATAFALVAGVFALVLLSEVPRLSEAWRITQTNIADPGPFLLVAGLVSLALLLATLAVARRLTRGLGIAGHSVALLTGVVAIYLIERSVSYPQLALLAALLALPLGWGLVRSAGAWRLNDAAPMSRAWLWCGALLAGVLALPSDLERNWSYGWLFGSVAWAVLRLWQIPAVVLLLGWLAEQGRVSGRRLPTELRAAGAVVLFIGFYWSPRLPWLPLLASALMGVGLLRWWVFATRPVHRATTRRAGLLRRAIGEIGAHHALLRLRRALAKGLSEKLAKGDLSLPDAVARGAEADQLLDASQAAAQRAHCRAVLALNQGPAAAPWLRGLRGAIAATVLALPWTTSYFVNIARGDTPPTNAYLVSQLGTIVLDLARWPLLGFVFLFFYPHLRGLNGIQKGAALTVSLTVPAALATLLWSASSGGAWQVLTFWALQVFICCMALGVGLGDLGALRRAGRNWRGLVDIYNLGTLAAWSSTLALAVGAAATTALASQAGSLFAVGLKLLLPELPTTPR